MREATNCEDYANEVNKLINVIITINGKRGPKKEYYAWLKSGGIATIPFIDEGKILELYTGEFTMVKEHAYEEGDKN